jgi:uncharacterized membrane protein
LPQIRSELLHNVFNKVLLMTIDSLPLWTVIVLLTHPPLPGASQLINTSLVALFLGGFVTGLFLFARNLASNSSELSMVDATQSSEVIFALLGGILFLKSAVPNIESVIGLILILTGLAFFVTY